MTTNDSQNSETCDNIHELLFDRTDCDYCRQAIYLIQLAAMNLNKVEHRDPSGYYIKSKGQISYLEELLEMLLDELAEAHNGEDN